MTTTFYLYLCLKGQFSCSKQYPFWASKHTLVPFLYCSELSSFVVERMRRTCTLTFLSLVEQKNFDIIPLPSSS